MPLSDVLVIGIDNFIECTRCVRYTLLFLVLGIVFQISGFVGSEWSSSPTSHHGIFKLCHNSGVVDCCDVFKTGWITAIFYCQILGLISSLITAIVVILFTCVSQTKGNATVGNILKVVSAITAVFIGSSAATYSNFYWKNHILADHHLSSSFTLVILACLSFQLICIIHTVKRAPDTDNETPLYQPTCETTERPESRSRTYPLACAVCLERNRTAEETPLYQSTPRTTERPESRSRTDPLACIVCLERNRNVIFSCNHVVCCKECAESLRRSDTYNCPVCRKTIDSHRRVYL